MMGRYLQIIKQELLPGQKRGEQELLPPPPRPYDQPQPYHDYPQSQHIGGGLTPETLNAILAAAKLQGAHEERQKAQDRETEAHHRGADRLLQAHLAIVDKINSGGGQSSGPEGIGAYWKYLRRRMEIWFWILLIGGIAMGILIAIWNDQPHDWPGMRAAPATAYQHKHYKHIEEYDDR